MQVAIVTGREGEVITPDGARKVHGKARLVTTPDGVKAVPGGEGAPIDVDTANQLLDAEAKKKLARALGKDRKRRKENLQGK